MKKIFWAYLIFFLIGMMSILKADDVTVPADTPFFTDRSLTRRAGITSMSSFETERVSGEKRIGRILWNRFLYPVEIVECRLPGQEGTFWFSPQVTVDPQNNIQVQTGPAWIFLPLGILSLALFVVCGFLVKKTEPGTAKRALLLTCMAALLHCCLLALFLYRTGDPISIFNDDARYLVIAQMIRSGEWTRNPFFYTIGYPILCIPYLFLVPDAASFHEFLPFETFVNGFIISSLFAGGAFLLLRRLSGRDLLSFGGVVIWQLFLFFHLTLPIACKDGARVVKSVLTVTSSTQFNDLFMILMTSGYNGMSDTASALLVMLCFLVILYLRRPLIPLALLFGFLCLIRINNIFFGPVLFFLLILRYREMLKKKGAFLLFCFIGSLCFLSVFSSQFVVNYVQFGNPFAFPYILHWNNASQGFLLSEFPGGFQYTCLWCNACLAWALPSLLLMKDRLLRTVLVISVMPMILFFSGYAEWKNFDMRGMISLYPFLFAAPFLSDWWKDVPKKVLICGVSAAGFATLFTSTPIRFFTLLPWHLESVPHGKTIYCVLLGIELAFLLYALIRALPYRELFFFLAMFSALIHSGTSFGYGILTAVLCGLALTDLIRFRRAGDGLEVPFLTDPFHSTDEPGR